MEFCHFYIEIGVTKSQPKKKIVSKPLTTENCRGIISSLSFLILREVFTNVYYL